MTHRQIEVTAGFSRAQRRLGVVAGSPLARRIAIEIRRLASADELPMVDDVEVLLPPVEHVWQHRVPQSGYLVVYGFTSERIYLRTLRVMGG